jgi:hypothetical protein
VRNVMSLGSRRFGWQFGTTAGPAELLLNASGDELQISAYRDAGSSTYRGWRQTTDGNGAWKLQQWFTPAGLGSESPVTLMTANISGVVPAVNFYPSANNTYDLGDAAARWKESYVGIIRPGDGTTKWTTGTGTPEGALTAVVGSLYTRLDGGAGTTLYVKESGTGNTGWVAK